MKKIKIICVVGPTASGKSDLGVYLAKNLAGEIISADSMQVYKGMSVATAAVTQEEMQGVPHHLVEILDPSQRFSVADFITQATQAVKEITGRNHTPFIVGGTGLFADSFINNISFSDVGVNTALRQELEQKTNDELYEELLRLDEKAAADIHKNNRKRVIRAIELCKGGITKTQQNENSRLIESPYDALYIGINYQDRERLYERINKRIDIMLKNGLVDEAKSALKNAGPTSAQAIGHKELSPYFNGSMTLDEAVENLKRETRRYAKRQITWFRRNENINWLYADSMNKDELYAEALSLAKDFLSQ